MQTVGQAFARSRFAVALLWCATVAVAFSSAAVILPPANSLVATRSGNDLILSFPTISPNLYVVQASPDLSKTFTNFPSGIVGDGTLKTVTISNAIPFDKGFYRLAILTPTKLLLPQSMAFAILGHSCGGIKEQVYVTGFDPVSGDPNGVVNLSTTCSTGGRGAPPATFRASAAVTWDLAGNVISSSALSNAVTIDPAFIATDSYHDTIYNVSNGVPSAYLVVPVPAAPTGVTAVQSGDDFEISWKLNGVNPVAIASSILTATPLNSTAAILTSTVVGSATTGTIASLQPQTPYQITVVNTDISGSSPPSDPITVTTVPASIPPSAPTGVSAFWTIADPTGSTDTLVASWQAADPGNSPIDQYRITIVGSDGAGTFTQTVSGETLTGSFTVDYIPNWSVTVKAHNAVGWGPSSSSVSLGGL